MEETGEQQEDRSAPPEVTPPGLAPTHQQNFTRLWETCLLKIASQPPEEQEYALKRVIAAAYALASPQDESHSDLARAEAETIRNGYFIGLDVPPAQPPAEPAAPPAVQPAVAEPASPAPTLPPASGPSEAPPDASSEPLEPGVIVVPLTPVVETFIDGLLRGEGPITREELNNLIPSLFSHLVLENSGSVEEIHPVGSSFEELLRNY